MPWAVVGGVAGAVVSSALAPSPSNAGQGAVAGQERLANVQATNAEQGQAFWNQNYKPIESQLATTAAGTGTAADQETAAGAAHGDVSQAYSQANKDLVNRISAYGINPSSPRAQTEMARESLAQGATDAGAMTAARQYQRNLGFARQTDAAQIGRGLQATSASQLNSAAGNMGSAGNTQGYLNALSTGLHNQAVGNTGYFVAPIAQAATQGLKSWWNSNSGGNQTPSQVADANYYGSGSVDTVPAGGYSKGTADVEGPGTEMSDSVPAQLSKHEAVLNAGAVRLVGKGKINRLNIAGMAAMNGMRGKRPPPANIGAHLASMGV